MRSIKEIMKLSVKGKLVPYNYCKINFYYTDFD